MPQYQCDQPKGTCNHYSVYPKLARGETKPCQRATCIGVVSRQGKHSAHMGTRSGINPNLVVGTPNFAGNFQTHMMHGENVGGGGPHSGLHSLNLLDAQGRINGAAANVVADDPTAQQQTEPFGATVTLGAGAPKHSTFFPTSMNYAAIRAAVIAAWQDYQRYSGVHIYQRMVATSGLVWVGYATLAGRKTWVGSDRNGVGNNLYTAFPAIKNKFT